MRGSQADNPFFYLQPASDATKDAESIPNDEMQADGKALAASNVRI